MKKVLSFVLVLTMLMTVLALFACTTAPADEGENKGNEEQEETTTTTKRQVDIEPSDDDDTPEEITLLAESEAEWKYQVKEVIYSSNDYIGTEVDEFEAFKATDPDWYKADYDDSEWEVEAAPFGDRIGGSNNAGYSQNNHGLFVRSTFELTQEQLDALDKGETYVYAYTWYDNTFHLYINGIEVYSHDDSDMFVEGTDGTQSGAHDWTDEYTTIELDVDDINEINDTDYSKISDILVAGTNVIACSLKDAWGGRCFDLGLYYDYN